MAEIGFIKKPGAVTKAVTSPIYKSALMRASEARRVEPTKGGRFLERALSGRLTFEKMWEIYKRNVWVHAIINKTVDRLSVIEPVVKPIYRPGQSEPSTRQLNKVGKIIDLLQNPNDRRESFMSLRKKYFRDMLVYDAAGVAVERNINVASAIEDRNIPLALYAAPGDEIKLNVDKTGQFHTPAKAYSQVQHGQEVESWGIDEMIYFIANPRAGSVYGTSPIESLVQTVTAELFASAYNIEFFSNNATPRLAITFNKMGSGDAAESKMLRFQAYWEQELQGKPHKPIFIGAEEGEVDIHKLNFSNEDMQFQDYSRWLLVKIMSVYSMQPIVLGVVDVSTGKLNSAQQQEQFKEDALKPKLKLESYHLNSELVWPMSSFGFRDVYITYEAVDLLDLEKLTKIWLISRKGGWLEVNEIRNFMGLAPLPMATGEPFTPTDPDLAVKVLKACAKVAGVPTAITKALMPPTHGIPTGLEEMEDSEIHEAVEGVLRQRMKKQDRIYLVGEETVIDLGEHDEEFNELSVDYGS